jgi:hypothetical protein
MKASVNRTPLFYAAMYVHTVFGLVAIIAPFIALRATYGGQRHRLAGWVYVQAVAGLFATTCVMASIRYTLFLFTIGYVAWYASHQAWIVGARRADRPYLASPLAQRVQHDIAVVLGLTLVAASVYNLLARTWPVTPRGLGLGVAFVYGTLLAFLGWINRTGAIAVLPRASRHLLLMGASLVPTYSEFFADVTNLFMTPSGVWISSWILPGLIGAWWVGRRMGLPAIRTLALAARPASGADVARMPS